MPVCRHLFSGSLELSGNTKWEEEEPVHPCRLRFGFQCAFGYMVY